MALIRDIEELRHEVKPTDLKALMDFIDEIAAEIPEEEWKKLPRDWAEHLDEYASGLRQFPE